MSVKNVCSLILLSCISFTAFSQSGLTSSPQFNYQLNGTDAQGIITKSDSILSVTCSDGNLYNVVSIEMSCSARSSRVPGNTFSKEMKQFLKVSRKGQRIFLSVMLRSSNRSQVVASTVFLFE